MTKNTCIYTHIVRHVYTRVLRTHTFMTYTYIYKCTSNHVKNMYTHDHTLSKVAFTHVYTCHTRVYFIYINI